MGVGGYTTREDLYYTGAEILMSVVALHFFCHFDLRVSTLDALAGMTSLADQSIMMGLQRWMAVSSLKSTGDFNASSAVKIRKSMIDRFNAVVARLSLLSLWSSQHTLVITSNQPDLGLALNLAIIGNFTAITSAAVYMVSHADGMGSLDFASTPTS